MLVVERAIGETGFGFGLTTLYFQLLLYYFLVEGGFDALVVDV